MSRKSNISVYVSSNVERALKQLKKKIEREGVVRDMKRTFTLNPQLKNVVNV